MLAFLILCLTLEPYFDVSGSMLYISLGSASTFAAGESIVLRDNVVTQRGDASNPNYASGEIEVRQAS